MNALSFLTQNKLAGRYRILRKLGEGSFAETFLAEDELLPGSSRCVVKKLKTSIADKAQLQVAKRLFETEAWSLHRLGSHDQVPRLFAHFEESREFYLVEEYIQGTSLHQELATGQCWSESYVIKLLQDILEVLQFVHQKRVIHRDLKPSNIIRREQDGKLVLIDFGAVKQVSHHPLEESSLAIPHTVIVGTPGYMPGEQLLGNPKTSSDVYAVGVLAIYALTGLNPVLGQLQTDESSAELLWHDHAHVSLELASVLDKMVAYDFRQRYPSATEAFDAVNALTHRYQTEEATLLKLVPDGVSEQAIEDREGSNLPLPTVLPKKEGVQLYVRGMGLSSEEDSETHALLPSSEALAVTSILPSDQSHVGTYQMINIGDASIARAEKTFLPAFLCPVQPKQIFLGGLGVITFGVISTLASPYVGFLCQALNNCPVTSNPLPETKKSSVVPAKTKNALPSPKPSPKQSKKVPQPQSPSPQVARPSSVPVAYPSTSAASAPATTSSKSAASARPRRNAQATSVQPAARRRVQGRSATLGRPTRRQAIAPNRSANPTRRQLRAPARRGSGTVNRPQRQKARQRQVNSRRSAVAPPAATYRKSPQYRPRVHAPSNHSSKSRRSRRPS